MQLKSFEFDASNYLWPIICFFRQQRTGHKLFGTVFMAFGRIPMIIIREMQRRHKKRERETNANGKTKDRWFTDMHRRSIQSTGK